MFLFPISTRLRAHAKITLHFGISSSSHFWLTYLRAGYAQAGTKIVPVSKPARLQKNSFRSGTKSHAGTGSVSNHMATEKGIIEKIVRRKAQVRIQPGSACAHCDSRESCHIIADKGMLIEMPNDLQAGVGDHIEIFVPDNALMKLSLLVYLFPILALIAGALAGEACAPFLRMQSMPASILGGILAMVATFVVLKRFEHAVEKKIEYMPHMTRILNEEDLHCSDDENSK